LLIIKQIIKNRIGIKKNNRMTGRTYRNAGVDQVRALVEKEIKGTIGMEAVNGIDIAIISHSTVIQMPTKNLSME
jgi:hypothetical protein